MNIDFKKNQEEKSQPTRKANIKKRITTKKVPNKNRKTTNKIFPKPKSNLLFLKLIIIIELFIQILSNNVVHIINYKSSKIILKINKTGNIKVFGSSTPSEVHINGVKENKKLLEENILFKCPYPLIKYLSNRKVKNKSRQLIIIY